MVDKSSMPLVVISFRHSKGDSGSFDATERRSLEGIHCYEAAFGRFVSSVATVEQRLKRVIEGSIELKNIQSGRFDRDQQGSVFVNVFLIGLSIGI